MKERDKRYKTLNFQSFAGDENGDVLEHVLVEDIEYVLFDESLIMSLNRGPTFDIVKSLRESGKKVILVGGG